MFKGLLCISSLITMLFVTYGCSLQRQSDLAEHRWLQARRANLALHSVELQSEAKKQHAKSFADARAASTYLTGQIEAQEITELSGLASVRGSKNLYWAINDSGNRPELFLMSNTGMHVATLDVPAGNRDWEDLASFELNGEAWLVIGETGDNLRRHTTSSLLFFKQPDMSALPPSLPVHHRVVFEYDDGPQNVESIAVSVSERRILLVTKNALAAKIYALPLSLTTPKNRVTAVRVGQLAELRSTVEDKWWEKLFAKRILLSPTAMDIAADDRLAVVANYRHAYLFRREHGESWIQALSREPQVLSTHRMQQSESIAFSAGSGKVVLSSEGRNAPVLTVLPTKPQSVAASSAAQ